MRPAHQGPAPPTGPAPPHKAPPPGTGPCPPPAEAARGRGPRDVARSRARPHHVQQRQRPGSRGRRRAAGRELLGGAAGPRLPPHPRGDAEGGADGKGGRGAGRGPAGRPRRAGSGRGRARGGSIAPRAGSRAAPVTLEGASSGEEFGAPRPCSGLPVPPAAPRGRPAWGRKKPRPKFRAPSFLFSGRAASDPPGGGECRGAALRPRKPAASSSLAAAASSLTPRRWASCHRSGLARARGPRPGLPGAEGAGTLGAAVPGPAPRLPREGLPSGPLDGSGHSGGLCAL